MGFLFKKKKKGKNVLIFDIGSGSVGGAFVHIPDDNKKLPTIIKSTRTEIIFHNEFNQRILFRDMLGALNFTATALNQGKIKDIDGIFCVMASPWYSPETRIIKFEKEKPFLLTKHLVDELVKNEILDAIKLYEDKYNNLNSKIEIIEHQIMGISLNGYSMNDPMNKRTRIVKIDTIISISPKLYLNKIRETLTKTFYHNHLKIEFSSFIIGSYLAIRDKYADIDSYLLLDISGQATDIGIVSKGVLVLTSSFPFGKNTFFKFICSKLEMELRDAKELFKLYSSDNISVEYRKKVEPLFKSIENSWGEAFRQCIDTLSPTLILPNIIFLTADDDIKEWFSNLIQNEKHIQEITFDNKCFVNTLKGPEFLNMCNVEEGTCDPFLMIEAIAIMRKLKK